MLYRPSYCSNCGEKIVRANWQLWTSRRFCDVCVADNPAAEYGPKAVILLALVSIAAATTSFIGGGSDKRQNAESERRVERPAMIASLVATPMPVATPQVEVAKLQPTAIEKPSGKQPVVVTDTSTICGALTKKGTACSRRVKGSIRCFQHQGMPSAAEIVRQ